jgi:hypothetical protein
MRAVPSPLRVLGIVAAYAVLVGGVALAVLATDDTGAEPWLALLAAMAVLHLGFGVLVTRFWVALLPLVVCVAAWLLDLGDFSITTLLVGVPCAMLAVAGVALRIGWDGGPRRREREDEFEPPEVAEIRAERRRAAEAAGEADWDPGARPLWDDAIA